MINALLDPALDGQIFVKCCYSPFGEKKGTPWAGCQSIKGQHRHTQDKQLSTNTQSCFWILKGSQSTQGEPTHAQGEHANSIQKDLRLVFEPRTFLLQRNSCTTVQALFYL
ncbi:hypothetical protein AMECASPLE_006764 [Ameca splendens]|uniref:Uncharacterized protein n=1 Tax=Ameca splendens TaxID=208324 RepID=A0ABV0XCK3_9TELE